MRVLQPFPGPIPRFRDSNLVKFVRKYNDIGNSTDIYSSEIIWPRYYRPIIILSYLEQ